MDGCTWLSVLTQGLLQVLSRIGVFYSLIHTLLIVCLHRPNLKSKYLRQGDGITTITNTSNLTYL